MLKKYKCLQHFTKSLVFLYEGNRISNFKCKIMKIRVRRGHRFAPVILVTGGLLVASFALLAWAGGPGSNDFNQFNSLDTVPGKNEKPEKDFDKEMRQLEDAKKQLQGLKEKNWEKVHQDVEQALKEIDLEKIRLEAENALRKVDMEKIAKDIESSLSKIDLSKLEKELASALDDLSKIHDVQNLINH